MTLWAKYKQLQEQRGKANLGNKTISEIVGRKICITIFLTGAYMHKQGCKKIGTAVPAVLRKVLFQ